MSTMHAAVVTSFDEPPHYRTFETPVPGEDQELVEVLAVGLHPRVRSGARGGHYTSTGTLPMIPGVDGVGRRGDGTPIYFVAADDVIGTMAERAIADRGRTVELPRHVDVTKVAAAMNPGMSGWVALRRRVPLQPGQSVLVLGATGNAGTMAVQIARHLGAGRVVGAGRDATRLQALTAVGADAVVRLSDDRGATAAALAEAAAEVDIVVDYLWGEPTQAAIDGAADGTLGPQPLAGVGPDRRGRRSDDRAPVGGAAVGQSPDPGRRPGIGRTSGLCRRAAVARRRDR